MVLRWNTKSHTFLAAWGKYAPILEDVAKLTMLPLFDGANSLWIVLDEDDYTMLKYLTVAHGCLEYVGQVNLLDLAMIL